MQSHPLPRAPLGQSVQLTKLLSRSLGKERNKELGMPPWQAGLALAATDMSPAWSGTAI